jgi:hypothetical protein
LRRRALRPARLIVPLLAFALLFARCADEFRFRGVLGQPIPLRADHPLPLVPIRLDGGEQRWAVVDIGSPVTVARLTGPARAEETVATIAVLDADTPTVTRLEFPDHTVYDYAFHGAALGTDAKVDGALGTDLWGRFALEIRLSRPSITLFDSVAGTDAELAADGWAVFPGVYKGGGRTEAGCTPPLPGRRLVVDACALDDQGAGTDLTLAVSTGLVDLTVGEAAAARLPQRIARLAIVGDTNGQRGPCEEYAWREHGHAGAPAVWVDGDFAVVATPDSDPALVSARAEVGGSTPGIDGFVGTAFLRTLRLRLDYPGARLLMRCETVKGPTQTCFVREAG